MVRKGNFDKKWKCQFSSKSIFFKSIFFNRFFLIGQMLTSLTYPIGSQTGGGWSLHSSSIISSVGTSGSSGSSPTSIRES